MTISKDKLDQLKNALMGEKVRIEKNMKVLEKDLDFGDSPGLDNEEADESEEAANEFNTMDMLKSRVNKIENALAKMESGKYGICEDCGGEIELELLEVNPESTSCKECKD